MPSAVLIIVRRAPQWLCGSTGLSARMQRIQSRPVFCAVPPPSSSTALDGEVPVSTTAPAKRRRTFVASCIAAAGLGAVAIAVVAVPANSASAVAPASIESASPDVASAAEQTLDTLATARFTGSPSMMSDYADQRTFTATLVANELGLDVREVRQAWARADAPHQVAVLSAVSQLGVPYSSMASSEGVAFDCSGLTMYAWGRAGVSLAHQSSSQIGAAAPRDESTAMAGDLVQYPGHVMMSLGIDNAIVHSPYTGKTVELTFVSSSHSVSYGNPIG